MKNNRGFLSLGLILVIIAVLIVAGGAYLLRTKNTEYDMYQPLQKEENQPINNNLNNEESITEIFNNQPGAIKSITDKGDNKWTLEVDLLSFNPKWLPGVDSTGGFFINQNPKIRNLAMTENTKTYNCGVDQKPSVLQNTAAFISSIQKDSYKTVFFDINGNNITAIYEQCLP